MAEILFKEESYAIVGACFNVYKDKGRGFLEPVYQECCEIEFAFQKIPFLSQTELELTYRDHILKQRYKPDSICFQKGYCRAQGGIGPRRRALSAAAELSPGNEDETLVAGELRTLSKIGI